jgi:hypothetical protein
MENHLAEIKTTQGKLVEVNQKILDQMASGIMLA